ncbi:hypothetical protein HU200_024996 [Digitaria exilis]|uniref:Uncharacterized protein n=1 Tax=Digitaria exilis TaxID=1010633 RepID=A0A835BXF0_9POAL|nr:hypothetical protein HU200_024996 [Digitaria exilis]
MTMVRQFVNIIAQNYKSRQYSLHRLDVLKHLFGPSRAQAPTGGMIERLPELPPPCVRFGVPADNSKMIFFGLVSPSSSDGKILCITEAGKSLLYDADKQLISTAIPWLGSLKAPASVVSLHRSGRFEGTCVRRLTLHRSGRCQGRRHSLPLPPFASHKPALISSYTVVEGGRTICLSALGVGTYCFDRVKGEWWQAGDWVLPFDGRADYVPDLNLWLGFSLGNPHELDLQAVQHKSIRYMCTDARIHQVI